MHFPFKDTTCLISQSDGVIRNISVVNLARPKATFNIFHPVVLFIISQVVKKTKRNCIEYESLKKSSASIHTGQQEIEKMNCFVPEMRPRSMERSEMDQVCSGQREITKINAMLMRFNYNIKPSQNQGSELRF